MFDGATKLAVSQQSYDAVGRAECAALRMNPATFASLPASACTQASAGAFGADRITKTVYNAAGQATKTISGFGTSLAQDTVTTSYTANGLVATLTDARGGKTSYDYDGHDRLKKTRFPNPSTANASSTTDYEELTYGTSGASLGLVTARRLRDGTSIAYAHDDLGRLVSTDAPGSTPDVTYAYDNFGRVTSLSQSGHSLAYVYDQLSRLVSETQPLGTVSYEYDAAGRRTKLTYPGSYDLDYDWSVAGDLLKIRENGASSGIGVLASYAYDNLGRRAALTRGNGNVTTYGFDAASRLTALDLDLDGATTTNDLAFDFAHNPASQIVSEDNANDVYDWTEPSAFTDAYTVNYLNQYLTAAGATIAHDARGNISSDGTTSFGYDAMNRLTSVSGGASAALAYDPASRLYEVDGTATTRFLYDGADIVAEYDGSNALLRRYVHGPGADEALVWLEGTDTSDRRFLIADTRGSIVAVTNASGATTDKNLYDAFGAPHAANAGRFQYTGQIWLAEAGLYHYKARAYSPLLGRFLQTDPIGYADGMNMYAYAGNDPINGRDPSGLAECDEELGLDNGEGDCTDALNDADAARDTATGYANLLRDIAAKDPKDRTPNENEYVSRVEKYFGRRAGSPSNLRKVASGLDRIAKAIGPRGEGVTLYRGDNKVRANGRVPYAYAPIGGKKIYLNKSFLDDSGTDAGRLHRQKTIIHEAAHSVGFGGNLYAGRRGYYPGNLSLDTSVRLSDRGIAPFKHDNYYINADSYACSNPIYEEPCR